MGGWLDKCWERRRREIEGSDAEEVDTGGMRERVETASDRRLAAEFGGGSGRWERTKR